MHELLSRSPVHSQNVGQIPQETSEKHFEQDWQDIVAAFEQAAARLLAQLPSEVSRPFDRPTATLAGDADFTSLTTTRRGHETKRAAQSVRTGKKSSGSTSLGK